MNTVLWRSLLVLSGILIFVGGPMHPGGTIAEMLADPQWVPSHALMLAGELCLLAGLVIYGRSFQIPRRTRFWLTLAIVGLVLQSVEMVLHTLAYVDHANLVAGEPTPVLTTHLWMTPAFYPVFGVTAAGFVLVAASDRALGSPWFAWLGAIGALAHGAAGFIVPLFEVEWARALFPLLVLLGIWAILTALWPVRLPARAAAT